MPVCLPLLFLIALLIAPFGLANAQTADAPTDRLSFSVGYYDILDDKDAVDLRAEYRFGEGFWNNRIKPFIGAEGTSDGALYGLGGLYADLYLVDNVLLTPSIGVGLYSDGDGKDLGHAIQFRSQLELAYEYADLSRVGVSFGHISNASLGERNPGTEILSVYYHVPVNW